MMFFRSALSLSLVLISLIGRGQAPFTLELHPEKKFRVGDMIVLEDGGLLLTGRMNSPNPPEKKERRGPRPPQRRGDVFLTRMDREGELQWTRTYGAPRSTDAGTRVIPAHGDGFLLVGYSFRYSALGGYMQDSLKAWAGDEDPGHHEEERFMEERAEGVKTYVLRVGKDGTLRWSKSIGRGRVNYFGMEASPVGEERYRIRSTVGRALFERGVEDLLVAIDRARFWDVPRHLSFTIDEEGKVQDRSYLNVSLEKRSKSGLTPPQVPTPDGGEVGLYLGGDGRPKRLFSYGINAEGEVLDLSYLQEDQVKYSSMDMIRWKEDRYVFRGFEDDGPDPLYQERIPIGAINRKGKGLWYKSLSIPFGDGKEKSQKKEWAIKGLVATPDEKLLFYGTIEKGLSEKLSGKNALVGRIGKEGKIEWCRAYGTPEHDRAVNLEAMPSGGMILQMEQGGDEDELPKKTLLLRLKEDGTSDFHQRAIDIESKELYYGKEAIKNDTHDQEKRKRYFKELKQVREKMKQRVGRELPMIDISESTQVFDRFSSYRTICE